MGADFRAGIARVDITPDGPIWMAGYASRDHVSEGVAQDLWAKALALEDGKGGRVVILTVEVIGIPRGLADLVAARVQKRYGLERRELLINASHIHSGPAIQGVLETMWDLPPGETARIHAYTMKLADDLVSVVGAALGQLAPATVSFGEGSADFAMNRREPTPNGIKLGKNPNGARDTSVPVIEIKKTDGEPLAVLFGYACHNTTVDGSFYQLAGDYAGFAAAQLEASHPGATAMFLMLCGGDIDPQPRGTLDLAKLHGAQLASAVEGSLGQKMRTLKGPIQTAFKVIDLNLQPYTREDLEKQLASSEPVCRRNAARLLKAWNEGQPVRRVPYPIQAVRLDKDLAIVALGGEPMVEYDLRIKRTLATPKRGLIVAGYSNDVMAYIPTARILKEGGYEASESMMYYGLPGPFEGEIEEKILAAVGNVLGRVGFPPNGGK